MKHDNRESDHDKQQVLTNVAPRKNAAATRRFTRLIKTLGCFMHVFQANRKGHTAKAILSCQDQEARRANLAFDDTTSHLAVSVDLGRVPAMSVAKTVCMQKVQQETTVSRLDYDAEEGRLRLRASCILPRNGNPEALLALLIADLQRALRDDRLGALMGT